LKGLKYILLTTAQEVLKKYKKHKTKADAPTNHTPETNQHLYNKVANIYKPTPKQNR
jgi:hypothetical protein